MVRSSVRAGWRWQDGTGGWGLLSHARCGGRRRTRCNARHRSLELIVISDLPPKMRLSLTGCDRCKDTRVLCPGAHGLNVTQPCARGSRPQLERDPLGGSPRSPAKSLIRVILTPKSGGLFEFWRVSLALPRPLLAACWSIALFVIHLTSVAA